MSLRPLALIVLLSAAGCGGGNGTEESRGAGPGGPCPDGTAEVRPRDVLPETPAGTSLGPADPKDAQRYVEPFQQGLGERLRSVRTAVVTERGEDFGTAVVVVNAKEKLGDPNDVLEGAQDSSRPGAHPEPYEIAGRPGMISEESDGAIAAVGIADCAMVMLSGPDTPMVKQIAGHMRAPE
jgi:hypothetical protein